MAMLTNRQMVEILKAIDYHTPSINADILMRIQMGLFKHDIQRVINKAIEQFELEIEDSAKSA